LPPHRQSFVDRASASAYRTKGGHKKVRYFIDPMEAMRLEEKLSAKKGITDITLGKA
jgi:hypothetical protein